MQLIAFLKIHAGEEEEAHEETLRQLLLVSWAQAGETQSSNTDSRKVENSDSRNLKDAWRQTGEGHSAPEVPEDGENTLDI